MKLASKLVFLLCLVISFFVLKNQPSTSAQAECNAFETGGVPCASGCTPVDGIVSYAGPGIKRLEWVWVECDPANGKTPACASSIPRAFDNTQCCDQDGDGWLRAACGGTDCNDTPVSGYYIHPNATEICEDGIDNDCQFGDALCPEEGATKCDDSADNDGDGDIDCQDNGCNLHCVGGCSPSQWNICLMLGGSGCYQGNCYTPVVLDMIGNGVELTNAQNGILFNVLPGVPVQLAWTTANTDDAWLVLDRNGNGTIDSGEELFGNATPQPTPPAGVEKNGFLALAEFDTSVKGGNSDGEISKHDAIFNSLRLWQDRNHNGVSEPAELRGLQESGVAVLELRYKESKHTDEHGNNFRYKAKVKDEKGAQIGRWAWDVFLRMQP